MQLGIIPQIISEGCEARNSGTVETQPEAPGKYRKRYAPDSKAHAREKSTPAMFFESSASKALDWGKIVRKRPHAYECLGIRV